MRLGSFQLQVRVCNRYGCLSRHHLLELNENAIRVLSEGAANPTSLRLRRRLRRHREGYAFALEFFVDRVQPLDPDSEVRDADLVDLNAAACRRQAQGGDQGDHARLFAHAVRRWGSLTVAQDRHPKLAILPLGNCSQAILVTFELRYLVGHFKSEQVPVEVQRAVKISHPERDVRYTFGLHSLPPLWSKAR